MKLPIFVINLASREERWESVQTASDQAGVKLVLIEAIDGRLVSPADWVDIDKDRFADNTAREIFPGEYGCYRSHILALETFIESEAPFGIILEDDVLPDADFLDRAHAIVKETVAFDVVKLVNHRAVGFISLSTTSKGDVIGRTLFGPQGSAAAYLVSREGAQKIVRSRKTMELPWDATLERYWENDTNVLTVKDNILPFSDDRQLSSIAPDGYSKKLSLTKRILTVLRLQLDHFRRFHHAALGPIDAVKFTRQNCANQSIEQTPGLIKMILSGVVLLVMLSVFWVESDAYRYAGMALVVFALYYYFGRDFWRYDRPLIGYAGIMCLLWGLFVGLRFGIHAIFSDGQDLGSAEGIYLFPVFYTTLGFGIWLFCRKPLLLVITFMVVSLGVLLVSTDYASLALGTRAVTFTHGNTIHASVAAGFILIFSICFTVYMTTQKEFSIFVRSLLLAIGFCGVIMALVNVLILTSKGVWLAAAVALPVLFLGLLFNRGQQRAKARLSRFTVIAAVVILCSVAIGEYSNKLISSGQATFSVGLNIASGVADGNGLIISMEKMIDSTDVPASARERLELWVDAFTIWSKSPIFGAGIGWQAEWEKRTHSQDFNIFHNGFLEVGVRHGLFGIGFYVFIFGWATRKVFLASKHELIAPTAANCYLAVLVFFIVTIMTNSNNRLAIGESFMWLAISFAFYCAFLLQKKGIERPRTWI